MELDLALKRQRLVTAAGDRAALRVLRLWRRGMTTDFDASWGGVEAGIVAAVASEQVAAAAGSSLYLDRTARSDGFTGTVDPVQPTVFGGVDASGRELAGLLFGAVTTAKTLIGAGQGVQQALMGGGTYLATMSKTAVHDSGRLSDQTASASHGYTHYIRVVSPGACSRCAILAGTASARAAFKRHPGCKCGSRGITEDQADDAAGRFASPDDYFASLSVEEQDRVFTRAGAEAIRAGADPISVVTARRGAPGIEYGSHVLSTSPNSGRRMVRTVIGRNPDGSDILGYTTGEGVTKRGAYGKQARIGGSRSQRIRLMPEEIVRVTSDPELRKVLLRDAGYLRYPLDPADFSSPLGGSYLTRRNELIREDRRIADTFYRSRGINLG